MIYKIIILYLLYAYLLKVDYFIKVFILTNIYKFWNADV